METGSTFSRYVPMNMLSVSRLHITKKADFLNQRNLNFLYLYIYSLFEYDLPIITPITQYHRLNIMSTSPPKYANNIEIRADGYAKFVAWMDANPTEDWSGMFYILAKETADRINANNVTSEVYTSPIESTDVKK
jgi:hypothetical protein